MGKLFEVGKKYTIYNIDSMLAMSHRWEIMITREHEGRPVFKHRGKRKEFIIKLQYQLYVSAPIENYKHGVFEGWGQPIAVDTDQTVKVACSSSCMMTSTMRGNACYNFVAEPEAVKAWIDAYQLNPHFDKSSVIATGSKNDTETVVYPDLHKGGHAVISRILEKQTA